MDSKNPSARRYLAQRAKLLGAIRLPDHAFRANAGAEVVADILFLQKREHIVETEDDWIWARLIKDMRSILIFLIIRK